MNVWEELTVNMTKCMYTIPEMDIQGDLGYLRWTNYFWDFWKFFILNRKWQFLLNIIHNFKALIKQKARQYILYILIDSPSARKIAKALQYLKHFSLCVLFDGRFICLSRAGLDSVIHIYKMLSCQHGKPDGIANKIIWVQCVCRLSAQVRDLHGPELSPYPGWQIKDKFFNGTGWRKK